MVEDRGVEEWSVEERVRAVVMRAVSCTGNRGMLDERRSGRRKLARR